MKNGVVIVGDVKIIEKLNKFNAATIKKAANRAINDAGKKATNAAIKIAREEYNVTNDSWLKRRLALKSSRTNTLEFRVEPKQLYRAPNLISFVDKGTMKAFKKGIKIANRYGVRVKIKRNEGGYKTLHRGFVMQSGGNVFVMRRIGRGKRDIKPATTTPALGMLLGQRGIEVFQSVAQETFNNRFEHHLAYYTGLKK
ncbi:MAG: phage tail protein [Campylobacteraceae bacterium]|jgi:hypothetical protein|nr:phage tail protein [Campylobacteraceae bacterium]